MKNIILNAKLMKITTILFIVSLKAFSQTVTVSKIEENRSDGKSSFSNNCKIELKVSGDEIRKYKQIRLGAVTKAVDDQGIDLFKENTWGNKYNKIEIDGIIEIELQKASRKAQTIKNLEGNMLLYNPTLANKGEIHIKDFGKKTTTNLLPANYPLKLIYLTKESLLKYKAEMTKKKEEDLKKLPEASRKLAESLMSLFDGLDDLGDEKREVVFLREGTEKDREKLVDIYFIDETGEKIERNGYFSSGNIITYPFSKDIQPNWIMVLNIESEQSIKSIPFKLSNINLP